MKYIVAILLMFVFVSTADAQSRRFIMSTQGGYCPAGTCVKSGGYRAINVKNCKAKHCRAGHLSR